MVKMSKEPETMRLIDYLHGRAVRLSGYVFAAVLLFVGMLFITQSIWWTIPALISMYVFGMSGVAVIATGYVRRALDRATATQDG